MANEYKNVERITGVNEADLTTQLDEKMLGQESATKQLGFKDTSGDMSWYQRKGSEAEFDKMKLTGFPVSGNLNVDQYGDLFVGDNSVDPDWIDFNPRPVAPVYYKGRFWYDEGSETMKVHNSEFNFDLALGRTSSSQFIADETITIGQPLYVSSSTPGDLHVAIASNKEYNKNWVIGIAGNSGTIGEKIEFVQRGAITKMDTSMWAEGVPLYLGDGVITDVRPQGSSSEIWFIGAVAFNSATDGALAVSTNIDPYSVILDGNIVEKQEITIEVINGIIYMNVSNLDNPTRNLPFQILSKEYELETITPNINGKSRVIINPGTSTVPALNTVYIEIVGGVPTLKATLGTIPDQANLVGYTTVLDAAHTLANGPLLFRRITSAKTHGGTGSLCHVLRRLGQIAPEYDSGLTPTATTDGTNMNMSVIAGEVWQTHLQDFPALSVDTSGIYVANGPGGAGLNAYTKYTNLADLLGWTAIDEGRDTSCTGQLVIFGLVNKDTNSCKLMVNLPAKLGATTASGGEDAYFNTKNNAIFSCHNDLRKTAFSIARIPYRLSGGSAQFVDENGAATNDGSWVINRLGKIMDSDGGSVNPGDATVPTLSQVLVEGNDGGGIAIKNIANATADQDATTFTQLKNWGLDDVLRSFSGATSDFYLKMISGTNNNRIDGSLIQMLNASTERVDIRAHQFLMTNGVDNVNITPSMIKYGHVPVLNDNLQVPHKGYVDKNNSQKIKYHKSGLGLSGNIVIPLQENSSVVSGHYLPADRTVNINRIEILVGEANDEVGTTPLVVELRRYPLQSATPYSVGNGTLVTSQTLLDFPSAIGTAKYVADFVDGINTNISALGEVLFCEVETNDYSCDDISITVFYTNI